MKLLYLSCHSIIEYDEVKMFKELGIDVFSHGAYLDPQNPEDDKRPGLPGEADQDLIKLARANPKENMSKEFLDQFDIIFFHWMPRWLEANFEKIKDKIVIFRTNGQSSPDDEIILSRYKQKGVKIVRYSPQEEKIPYYCGADSVIRFGKDPDEFCDWTGCDNQIITFAQNMEARSAFCNFDVFKRVTDEFPTKLFGPDNERSEGLNGGCLSYDDLKKQMRDSRVYFYTGTKPACYTLNFIEAMMTGIPIVSIGSKLGNPEYLRGQETFEIDSLFRNGEELFYSDNEKELKTYCYDLLEDFTLAKKMSMSGRKAAIELFRVDKIREEWRSFFDSLDKNICNSN